MNLTESQKQAVIFAISTCVNPLEVDEFFQVIDDRVTAIGGSDENACFLAALEFARRKNNWVKDPIIYEVKRITGHIYNYYKDKPFYNQILELFEDGNKTTREISNDPGNKKLTELNARVNNIADQLESIIHDFEIYKENKEANPAKELLSMNDMNIESEKLIELQKEAQRAQALLFEGSIRTTTVVTLTLDALIEKYQDPNAWLELSSDEARHEAENNLQTFQQINKAMAQMNAVMMEYPFYAVYGSIEKTDYRVIDYDYSVTEQAVILTLLTNEGKVFPQKVVSGTAAIPITTGADVKKPEPVKKPTPVNQVGFTSWKDT